MDYLSSKSVIPPEPTTGIQAIPPRGEVMFQFADPFTDCAPKRRTIFRICRVYDVDSEEEMQESNNYTMKYNFGNFFHFFFGVYNIQRLY